MSQGGTAEGDAVDGTELAARTGGADPVVEPPRVADEEELLLDPRAIARASLAAGRNASLWWVATGVAVAVAVTFLVGTSAGARVVAALLAVGAIVRAATPAPGPAAFVVRGRPLDVTILFAFAFAVAVFAQLLPAG